MSNDVQQDLALPEQAYMGEIESGSIKAIKSSTRRSDAFVFLPLDRIKIKEGLNVRIRNQAYLDRVRALADSMKEHGFRIDRPLSCFVGQVDGEDVVYVTDGHTRHEAASLAIAEGADIPDIPLCLLPKGTSMDDVLAGMHRANTGVQFNMLELSILAKRLSLRGHSPASIGRELGVAGTHVDNLLILAGVPHVIHMLIAEEKVAPTTVVNMIKDVGTEKMQAAILAEHARQTAEGKGEIKIRPRQVALPGTQVSPAVRKASGKLYDAITTVTKDPGFASLSESNRRLVEELLASIEQATPKDKPEKAAASTADDSED